VSVGSFIFVLHSHVPYVRKSGKWPHGEEMLYEIIAETYVPLLNVLDRLFHQGIKPRLSLGLTPILLEQLSDTYMQKEFVKYIATRIKAAQADYKQFKTSNPEALPTVQFYINWYTAILNDYEYKYNRDLINAFKFFQDYAGLDILTSAATHGYLPLISKDSAIWGQLRTGIQHYEKYFNRKPTGIWLPECGYTPIAAESRQGIESFLDEMELRYFFTDTHVIEGSVHSASENDPEISQSNTNDYSYMSTPRKRKSKKGLLDVNYGMNSRFEKFTTFHPYLVDKSNVYVFGRDQLTGMQVWSADWGYPGDYVYREFHKKAPNSGLQYWKISNKKPGLKYKELYNPEYAFSQAEAHADHFTTLVADHLEKYYQEKGKKGVVVSSYDTELFGHWWFEGIHWLEHVIKKFHDKKRIDILSARDYIAVYPETSSVKLAESSWGNGGHHSTWLNADTTAIWQEINKCEHKFENLVKKFSEAKGVQKKLLNQAARELLLLQSSDWTFLITTVQAKDYAEKRFYEHTERFNSICDAIENSKPIDEKLELIFDQDNAFKDIDYLNFLPI
jgi:1,4-alpha-glucan branching enzyme